MKIAHTIWLLLLLPFFLRAQTDSLDQLLQKRKFTDTTAIKWMLELAFSHYAIDPEKGIQYADSAMFHAQKIKHLPLLATAWNYKGVNLSEKGKKKEALQCYAESMKLREKIRDTLAMGKLHHNMGMLYQSISDYPNAMEHNQAAYDIFFNAADTMAMAHSMNNQGTIYLDLADYPRALHAYLSALKAHEHARDSNGIANACTNIGLVYNKLMDTANAFAYHHRAMDLYRRRNNQLGMARTFGNIGNAYSAAGMDSSAMDSYEKALELAADIGSGSVIGSSLSNLGTVYLRRKDFSKAREYLQSAIDVYTEMEDWNNLAISSISLANVYMEQSVHYDEAEALLRKSLNLAIETGAPDVQSDALGDLSALYKKQGSFRKALEAFENHILLRDSVLSMEKKDEITRLGMQYAFDKKEVIQKAQREKEQAEARLELRRQRTQKNFVAGALVLLTIAAVAISYFYKRRRDAAARQKEAEFRALVSETEMKVLRLQMNPHFIFNSLNAINDCISRMDHQTAGIHLTRFAKLIRMILEFSEKEEITLQEECEALEMYMQLERLRLRDKFDYAISIAPEIDPENTYLPPLMLQPFVENSIWHGISPKNGKGFILVNISSASGQLICIVEDNGVGRKAGQDTSSKKSMGIHITRSRMEILNRTSGKKAELSIEDKEEGVRVILKLPLETDDQEE